MQSHSSALPVVVEGGEDLQFEYRPLTQLTALGRKAKIHTKSQIAAITASIREFGFLVPVLVDDEIKVLAGHARLEAASALGMSHVPTVCISHLSPAQKRAFVLAENRLAELGGWDKATLKAELLELTELELEFDLTVIGFNEPEIDAIILGGECGGERGDAIPKLPDNSVSHIGDLWLLGGHKLICGDARDPAVLCALMGEERARSIFTDAPYNVNIQGHVTSSEQHGEFAMASYQPGDVGKERS